MSTNQLIITRRRRQSTYSTLKTRLHGRNDLFRQKHLQTCISRVGAARQLLLFPVQDLEERWSCGLPAARLFPCGSDEIPYSGVFYLKHC